MFKVYDCFLFSYNPDILEIRLSVLNDVVDRFVIVESPYNWHGMFKGLTFVQLENLNRFKKFLHKIEYIPVLDMPKYENLPSDGPEDAALRLETFNRNAIARGLTKVSDDDLVIISDFDEIPKPEIIKNLKESGQKNISVLTCLNFKFRLNSLILGAAKWWTNSVVVPGTLIHKYSISQIRWGLRNDITEGKNSFNNLETNLLHYAGWHFTWVGDTDHINEKLDAYRHNDFRYGEKRNLFIKQAKLREHLSSVEDTVNVPIDSFFPQYLIDNQEKYSHLISNAIIDKSGNDLLDVIYKD